MPAEIRRSFKPIATRFPGVHPSRNPVKPADIITTLYHCLGIDAEKELQDRLSRPFALVPGGEVIREVLA